MTTTSELISEMTMRLAAMNATAGRFRQLADAEVVDLQHAIASLQHELSRWAALSAAEIAHRSRPECGGHGLAQRQGHLSAEAMLQASTGTSKREARSLAAIGTMIAETTASDELAVLRSDDHDGAQASASVDRPWYAALADAIEQGVLSVVAVQAIRAGLGEPSGRVSPEAIAAALPAVIEECRSVNADRARFVARAARDRLDLEGVAEHHDVQRQRQFWRLWVKDDGMVRGEFELEPENGMLMKSVFDQLAHPRRVGSARRPRAFGDRPVRDERFAPDPATRQREAAEGLVHLVRAGASVDPDRILDDVRPGVRLVVNDHAVRTGMGFGALEGHHGAVPLTVIDRALCEGHVPLRFDDEGRCLDLGREKRLFSKAQKIALAVRDGGCMDPGCDRPPSWTEAHHIDHWLRDGGRTDLADGILLCRRDHLRYHNQGWEIRRDGAEYWLIPPPTIDPEQTPRRMRSKTRAEILNPVVLDARHRPAEARPTA
ncbi:DUF222 domain-containing protein [Agromyces sp. NPDC058484]|uniref:HNH endonuclease signature motif containing protein n=1 Tax=Agromyces sp. NPDC058484 TaxID=3346524 RepID=UPI00366914AD